MKVVATINASLVSKSCALLALQYAKQLKFDLVLLHLQNDKDSLADVNKVMHALQKEAESHNIICDTVILNGAMTHVLPHYFSTISIDTLFCSTRVHSSFLSNSFSEKLLKMKLKTNIAIVRIVHTSQLNEINAILLPIKDTKLSVYKFTFFATLATAFKSRTQIYSVSMQSRPVSTLREKLAYINSALSHYVTLSKLMPFTLTVKHQFTTNEPCTILHHMAENEYQLVIVGAKRLTFFSRFRGERPIEKLMRETSTNLIAFYPKEP